ncbi:MAG: glycosyltransferase family 4 protein [Deltaproteobacteria bacterium]|nr:glycosyltransferase family 4 protein [Deltaproteobacteria bacterium]
MPPTSPLNILFVGTLPPRLGGSAIANSQLLIGCAALGHTVRALAPITAEALQSGDAFAADHPSLGVTRYRVPSFENSPDRPASDHHRQVEGTQIQEMLPALITHQRPDILIIGREAFASYVPQLARTYSLPCLLMVHGATTIGILTGTYPEALARQLLEQYRQVALIVTPAHHMADNLRRLGLMNLKVIANAVDLQRFAPRPKNEALRRQLAIRDDDITVLHVSNLKSLKRPLDLVKAAERTLPQNSTLVYVIVGDGPCRAAMEDACRSSQIAEKFRFVGEVSHERIPDYLNLADMVVMPSAAETQALVYLETQACARLLLASDIPGAREVIVNGETGLLFRTGDIDDLTAKTLLAASDPKRRADIGRTAWERVQVHSLSHAVATYAATLAEVVRQQQK